MAKKYCKKECGVAKQYGNFSVTLHCNFKEKASALCYSRLRTEKALFKYIFNKSFYGLDT